MKTFIKFLTEAKDNPIKMALSNFLSTYFNEPKTLTNKEFIEIFYEGVMTFIKEYFSDHDLEEISKEEIDNAVSDNLKRKIPSYDPKSYLGINFLDDQIKDEKLLAIPNLIYNHYVFYHYKDYFIFNLASRTDSWKDEQIEYHLIPDLFSSLEDLVFDVELIQDEDLIFKLNRINKLSLDFLNIFPKNPFSKITLRTLDFSNKQLKKLPSNLPNVQETFDCSHNQLTTLEGSPKEVGDNFYCSENKLTSLKGSPKEVKENFNCCHNKLTSLKGAPEFVGEEFYCCHNKLTSLKGAPRKVGGNFDCSENKLTSLEGAPKEVGGDFDCSGNFKKFTEEEVRAVCKVGGRIEV